MIKRNSLPVIFALLCLSGAQLASASEDDGQSKKDTQYSGEILTPAEKATLNQQKWSLILSQEVDRSLDPLDDSWSSVSSFDFSRLLDDAVLGISAGYQTSIYNADGWFRNYAAGDAIAEHYGLSDTVVYYVRPSIWNDSLNRLSLAGWLRLPTSDISQRISLISELNAKAVLTHKFKKNLNLKPSLGLNAGFYQYQESDAFGLKQNSPFSFNYGMALDYGILSNLMIGISYEQVQRVDYESTWLMIQRAAVFTDYQFTDESDLLLGYRYQDQMLTNEYLFDVDRSQIFLSLNLKIL